MSSAIAQLAPYTTVFSQCFSPSGDLLLAGNHLGRIAVWKVARLLERSSDVVGGDERSAKPFFSFADHANKPVFAMTATEQFLITGSVGEIHAYAWEDIMKKSPKKRWSIALAPVQGAAIETEVNLMCLDRSSASGGLHSPAGRLVVAGGDNVAHVFDLETRRELHALQGHEDYLHGVACCNETGLIASAGEDGTVKLWDVQRKRPCTATLKPYERPELARPSKGKWIGAVDVAGDWLVCGGGPRAALWHLRTLAPAAPVLPPADAAVTVAHFAEDTVIIGGHTNTMYHANFSGHVTAEVPTTASAIYSIIYRTAPIRVLSVAGGSSKIDLCTPNFSYKDQTITFPPASDAA